MADQGDLGRLGGGTGLLADDDLDVKALDTVHLGDLGRVSDAQTPTPRGPGEVFHPPLPVRNLGGKGTIGWEFA